MIWSSIDTICTLLYTAPIARISFPGVPRGRGRRGPLPRGDALGGEPGRRARRRPPHRKGTTSPERATLGGTAGAAPPRLESRSL